MFNIKAFQGFRMYIIGKIFKIGEWGSRNSGKIDEILVIKLALISLKTRAMQL